ncbi:MAG: hypothetical protein D6798_06110 [Deltaproteobacteria bacterium]|nr:MAG: hypothetical protein D6798_06110 [Deltaproteobacteria bacterium]
MRAGCRKELTTRADQADLPAYDGTSLKFQALLDGESCEDTWRIVEAFSRSGGPFELELAWSAGSGSGATAQVTVARAVRICIFARSLRIRAANLSSSDNRVGVTVADGYGQTRNQWEHRDTGPDQGVAQEVPIPPFARTVRLEIADPTQLPGSSIKVYDGEGTLRAAVAGDAQPEGGVPVGGAGKVEVTAGATDYRVVYHLSL